MPLPSPASVRDRTPEFFLLCERLQKQLGSSIPPSANGSSSQKSPLLDRHNEIAQHSEFARKAAEIGHGIHKTSVTLQQLAQLAKRTYSFDDPAKEVDELTGLIKHDIQKLNNAIAELQRISDRGKDSSKQSLAHSHTVVDSLRSRLKDTTSQFKEVLTVRNDNLKHQQERRQIFSSTDADARMPLLRPHPHQGNPFNPASQHMGDGSGGGAPAPAVPSFMQTAQQLAVTESYQDTHMSSRAEALRNVESTIAELGTIFNKLSELVAEQGHMAIRIDENIDTTLDNVTSAQAQLLKYLNTISSNRWLIMKVFLVLLIFMVFFIMFIA